MKDFLAWYGAVMATIAIACQVRGWLLDKAKLKLEGHVSIRNTPRLGRFLSISAVNRGRRPVKIKRVMALLTKTLPPMPPGLSPDQVKKISRISAKTLVSHELPLFDGPEQEIVELTPDGGCHTWEYSLADNMELLSHRKGRRKCGSAYVMLTSGKKIFFKIGLLQSDDWPPFSVEPNLQHYRASQ